MPSDTRPLEDIQKDAKSNFDMLKPETYRFNSIAKARVIRNEMLWNALDHVGVRARASLALASNEEHAISLIDRMLAENNVDLENREAYDDMARHGFYVMKNGELVHFIGLIKDEGDAKYSIRSTVKP